MTALMRNVHMRGLSAARKEETRIARIVANGIRVNPWNSCLCPVGSQTRAGSSSEASQLGQARPALSTQVRHSQGQSCMQASQSGFGSRVGQPGTRDSEPPSEGGTKRRDANCANCREWNPCQSVEFVSVSCGSQTRAGSSSEASTPQTSPVQPCQLESDTVKVSLACKSREADKAKAYEFTQVH